MHRRDQGRERDEICWYFQEGERCPFRNTRHGCRYRCYIVDKTRRIREYTARKENKQFRGKEPHTEMGEVRQKLGFLEERLGTVLNHLTLAQRAQMGSHQSNSLEAVYQSQPRYAGVTRGY